MNAFFSEDDGREAIPLPRVFFESLSGKPHKRCVSCDRPLLADTIYMIEKVVMRSDVKYEFAICMDCADNMRTQMSEDSRARIDEYMRYKVRMPVQFGRPNPEKAMSRCMVTGKSVQDLEEYHLFALCQGENLADQQLPYMLSAEITEKVNELLSPETRDEWDRFMDDFVGVPPEYRELFKDITILV
jgi:hypothetical protein